jgi:hypothetical protein
MHTVLQQILYSRWQTVAIVGVAAMCSAKFAVLQCFAMKLKDNKVTAALQTSDTVYDLKI